MSIVQQQTEERYLNGFVFYDEKTQFTLNLSGFSVLKDLEEVYHKQYKYAVQKVLAKAQQVEKGAIVNHTSVKEETEDRAVDHYNLRHVEELVPGKSLQKSLDLWTEIKQKVSQILDAKTFTDVIFNGIGGSFLGPLMLVIAIRGDGFNFNGGLRTRLHFVSNTDSDSFANLMKKLNLGTTLMVNMSKSGGTAETKGNMDAFNDLLKANNIEVGKHNIAITTKNSNFDKFAQTNKFSHIFYMNEETGGRTSVVSAIGMVPCAFAEIPFDQFLKGQSYMDQLNRKPEVLENPGLLCAIAMDYLTKQEGRKNMIVLGYSDFLKEYAHYLQQLYMESLGKQFSEDGSINPEGQTVFGGVGTGEQHAFMQQVQKGIPDCFVKFIYFLKRRNDFNNELGGSMGRQLLAFVKGTEDALLQNGRPFISCQFEQCDLFNLGMMVALEERIVTNLAIFRNINAYDQPGVQAGKIAATQMNQVSKTVENSIAEKLTQGGFKWSGDAVKAREEFVKKPNTPIWFVDAVMADIYANVEVKDSFPKLFGKVQVSRKFENHRFIYHIASKM